MKDKNIRESVWTMLSCFPSPYPDESFYSLLARYSKISGNNDFKNIIKALYGNSTKRASHFLNSSNVPLFDGFSHMNLTPEELIFKYTILPFYSAFIPQFMVQSMVKNLLYNNEYDIHKAMGINSSPFTNCGYLAHCTQCIDEDVSHYGETYWHRAHQIPGVLLCPKHKLPLMKLISNECLLASEARFESSIQPRFSKRTADNLYFIAREAQWLLNQRVKMYDLNSYKDKYVLFLQQNNIASLNGRVDQRKWYDFFTQNYPDEVLNLLDSSVHPQNSWLQSIVRNHTEIFHPIRNLLVIKLMSSSLQEFFTTDYTFHPFGEGPWPCFNAAHKHFKEKVITNLKLSTCNETNRCIGTFTCKCGFIYSRRGPDPKRGDKFGKVRILKFGPAWKRELRNLAAKGLDTREIGLKLGVNSKTVQHQLVLMDRPHWDKEA